jgi:glycosyltransferase involved in cell wall biosynthesis
MELIDKMLCVSDAQRSLILSRNVQSSKINVVRNGFDPDVFSYSGPQARDWHKLIFIGRIEPPKGIHIIVQVFGELKKEFPRLTLDVFGDESYWPQFISQKHELMRQLAGLKFWGKVPQRELSQHLRTAGLLVFPSISFETAGLAVIDAQASGCPVIATAVGGVPEYVFDGVLGELVYESWLSKEKISPYISNGKIKVIIDDVINMGAYGAKLLGSGGCGFVLAICNPIVKKNIIEKYKESVLDFKIDKTGVTTIYE